jgi:ectoine hydroxylase-related dioxygenase (phytanoyl-CoA dioxygenase family)
MELELNNYRYPFVDSPFYKSLRSKNYNKKHSQLCDELNETGYCVVDFNIPEDLIDQANVDIRESIEKNNIKLNSSAYHYNESPRIVEAWKTSNAIKKIASNKKISDFLSYCYQSEAIPFSTINFVKGTEQPLHSDEFHFGSIPHRYLTGCWIALEDISPDSGPLSIAEGSHKLPIFSFESLGLSIPKSPEEFKEYYTIYEDWVREIIKSNNLKISTPILKKGQVLVWLSNTLHGSYEIKDKSLTRQSLVVHFHYEKCERIFYPSYSHLEKGKFIPRSLKDLDIRSKT